MKFLCYEVSTYADATIRVDLEGSAANVRVMDFHNFQQYRHGRAHRYFGGHFRQSPALVGVPHAGHWYVVVDLGGYPGRVSASVAVSP